MGLSPDALLALMDRTPRLYSSNEIRGRFTAARGRRVLGAHVAHAAPGAGARARPPGCGGLLPKPRVRSTLRDPHFRAPEAGRPHQVAVHVGDRGLTLLGRVHSLLAGAGVSHALIGAAALALHGVSRSTHDLDLLATDPSCLTPDLWASLGSAAVEVEIRKGDHDDPLAGVVRFTAPGDSPVDLVVGKARWQAAALARAESRSFADVELPVLRAADLILLKLYAGGPQDAWDIVQLLAASDEQRLSQEIEPHLAALPAPAVQLWRQIHS